MKNGYWRKITWVVAALLLIMVESERNIDYAYHIQKEAFLDEKSLQAEKDDLAIYRASFMLTKEGQVNQVILLDQRFATTFK